MNDARRGRGLARRLALNTLHAASGRVAAVLVWLVFTPMILRGLGPQGFGVWALFFALTGQLAALDFGLVQGTLRHVAAARERGDHEEAGAFATLALLGYVALGVVWLVVLAALGNPILDWLRIPPDQIDAARFALWVGAGVFVVAGFANVTMAVAQASGRFDLANLVTLVLTAQQAIGIPLMLAHRYGLRGLVVNVAIAWAFALVLGLLLLPISSPGFRWVSPARSLRHWREALRFGGPMQLTSILWTLNLQVDKLLLARYVSLVAVTTYELGSRVALSAFTFPQLLLAAVLPTAAALHARDNAARLRELHDRVGRYVLTGVALTTAILIGSSNRIYLTWLGPGHADAAMVVRWLAVTSALLLTAGTGSVVARGIGRTDLETWYHVIGLAVHLTLSLLLLPRIGLLGALIGSTAGNLAGTLLFVTLIARTMKWPSFELLVAPHLVPVIAAAAGAIAALAVDRVMPDLTGASSWLILGVVASSAALVALAVSLLTRYIGWREATALLRPAA
jgi:O-antigen/teichoic acid export membrane protein